MPAREARGGRTRAVPVTAASDKRIRIILADDHTLVRAGIRALIERLGWVEVVQEASDGRQLLELAHRHGPDVVVMDIGMPGLNGLEAAARLAAEKPEVRVLILSMHQNEEYVRRALRVGVAGYVLKGAATAELGLALERVARGGFYLSSALHLRGTTLPGSGGVHAAEGPLDRLTERQREILQLIAEGHNTKGIAATLKVSPKTVEYHRIRLMKVLNVHDVAGLVRFAIRVGLVGAEH